MSSEKLKLPMQQVFITYEQFAEMADRAIAQKLILCCAPHWVDGERKYIIHSFLTGKVLLMSEAEASFYLLGLLEKNSSMKTVKLKLALGLTLAHPQAPLGFTPSGAVIFEVTDAPNDVTYVELVKRYQGYWKPFFGKGLSVKYPNY